MTKKYIVTVEEKKSSGIGGFVLAVIVLGAATLYYFLPALGILKYTPFKP